MKNKKIGSIVLFIILLSYALLVGGTMPYFLLYVYILSFLIPLFHSLIILIRLEASIQLPKEALYIGDEININYKIDNTSIFHIPYLEIHSHISEELTGEKAKKVVKTLKPGELIKYSETINLKRRGYYELGKIEVIVSDAFRFFHLRKKIASETSLLIYPKAIELSNFTITAVEQLGELPINNIAFQDKSRISSIRNFREGDNIKSIHWKLSAKLDNIIIKNYENRGDAHTIVLIDNYNKHFENDQERHLEDKIVDISLSIINYYLNQNIPVNFKTQNNNELIEIQGHQKTDIKPFLDSLARFKANGALEFSEFIIPQIDSFRKDSTVIIITPNLNKSMGTLGISLKIKGLKPLFIIAKDKKNNMGYLEPIVKKGLRQEGIPIYLLDYETNIKEALEGKNG